jgi:hypothetical protein
VTNIYLDTNAVNYLFGYSNWAPDHLKAVRRALAGACGDGRLAVVVSLGLAEELAGLQRTDPIRYGRMVKFVYDLAGWRILLPLPERMKGEVVTRAKLGGRAPFLSTELRAQLRRSMTQPSFAQEAAYEVHAQRTSFEEHQRAKRTEVRKKLGPKWAAHTRDWWQDALPLIDLWTSDDMAASPGLNLPGDRMLWPRPVEVPSAWHAKAYQMARIALTVGENRRIQGSDLWDAIHYADAIYADVMVTDDGPFVETCNAIPAKPFAIESFRAFAEQRLGVAPG